MFATFYSVIGGMHSIVIGDLIKYSIMTVACVCIAVIAVIHLHDQALHVPDGWLSPFFGKDLGLNWSAIIPDANKKLPTMAFRPSVFSL